MTSSACFVVSFILVGVNGQGFTDFVCSMVDTAFSFFICEVMGFLKLVQGHICVQFTILLCFVDIHFDFLQLVLLIPLQVSCHPKPLFYTRYKFRARKSGAKSLSGRAFCPKSRIMPLFEVWEVLLLVRI